MPEVPAQEPQVTSQPAPVVTATGAATPRSTSAAPAAAPRSTTPTAASAAPPAKPSAAPTADDDDDDPVIEERGKMTDTQRAVFRAVGVCVEKSRSKGDGTTGSLSVELTLDAAGAVTDVSLGPGYSKAARACVEPKLRAIHFPAPANGGMRVVRYAIDEAPEGD